MLLYCNAFTGGTDDEAHDFIYMTDGKRYVKVDMSSSTPSCPMDWPIQDGLKLI